MYLINKTIVLKLNFMVELWVLLPSRVSPLLASTIVGSMWHLVTHILSMYTTPPLVHLARCYLGDTCCTKWMFSSTPALVHIHETQHILPTHKVILSTEIAKFLMKGLHAWNQGHRKVSKGGVTIGKNFRGWFPEAAKQLRNHTKLRKGSGNNFLLVCSWVLPPDEAITLTQIDYVLMLNSKADHKTRGSHLCIAHRSVCKRDQESR